MKKLLIILPLLTACDDHPKIVLPPQPVQYQTVPSSQPPVIMQESSSGIGSFAAGAALGALAGHVGTNMLNDKNSPNSNVSDRKMDTNIPLSEPKKNYMDTAKLSSHGKQDTVKSLPPSVSLAKPSMNMSKLSNHGKR